MTPKNDKNRDFCQNLALQKLSISSKGLIMFLWLISFLDTLRPHSKKKNEDPELNNRFQAVLWHFDFHLHFWKMLSGQIGPFWGSPKFGNFALFLKLQFKKLNFRKMDKQWLETIFQVLRIILTKEWGPKNAITKIYSTKHFFKKKRKFEKNVPFLTWQY